MGYNGTYKVNGREKIAVVSIGYADGIIRKNTGKDVYINNKMYKIVGNICIDSHEIISCNLGCCKQCLFQRDDVSDNANFILSDVRQNDECNGKIVCEVFNNFLGGAYIVIKPAEGTSYWLIWIS